MAEWAGLNKDGDLVSALEQGPSSVAMGKLGQRGGSRSSGTTSGEEPGRMSSPQQWNGGLGWRRDSAVVQHGKRRGVDHLQAQDMDPGMEEAVWLGIACSIAWGLGCCRAADDEEAG